VDRLADVLIRLQWAPLRGPARLVHAIDEPWATGAALILGAVAGLVLAATADAESLTVRLSRTEVVLTRPGHRRSVPRADGAVASLDGDRGGLLGRAGRELAREPSHLPASRLAPAFAAHGIGWGGGGPPDPACPRGGARHP